MKFVRINKYKVAVFLLCLLLLIYLVIFFNTTSLVHYVESIFRGEIDSDVIAETRYDGFDITKERPNIDTVDIKITRVFVLHNFKKGYMIVKIDCEALDFDGSVAYGDHSYERWEICKAKNKWEIVDIKANTGGRLFEY